MISEQLYRRSWKMAYELLQGLQTRNLNVIEEQLKPLRETLIARHRRTGTACDAAAFLWLEQLDLLEGITESVEASLEAIRRSNQPHLLRMQTAESLLRHLIGDNGGDRHLHLPVC
jgi:hypothetical protein